jgi:hypothetical protein
VFDFDAIRGVEEVVWWLVKHGLDLTTKVSGAGAPKVRRAPSLAMKMAKPWPVLASALNRQLGWGAKWKEGEQMAD